MGLLSVIKKYFSTFPKAVDVKDYRFYSINSAAAHFAFTVHLAWVILFGILGVTELFYFNFLSIAVFVLMEFLNRRSFLLAGALLGITEVCLHQVLAAKYVGWDCGFQYFILIVCIFPFMQARGNSALKIFWAFLTFVSFLMIELLYRKATPVYEIDETVVNVLNIVNISSAFVFLAFWGALFNIFAFRTEDELENEKKKSDLLLENILPVQIAEELKEKGSAAPVHFDKVTVMFTDFMEFAKIAKGLPPAELVADLNECFTAFDEIIDQYDLEKIKTIGDSFMCAGGIPVANDSNPIDAVRAGLAIAEWMENWNRSRVTKGKQEWKMRIGIHTGEVIAGVIGKRKFQYDLWGDAVNVASRMESTGDFGKINISADTYHFVKDHFECEYRGEIEAKNRGKLGMYYVKGPRSKTEA